MYQSALNTPKDFRMLHSKQSIKSTDSLNVNITIINTGNYDGAEVGQLYLRFKTVGYFLRH
jgi:hypothetical protein